MTYQGYVALALETLAQWFMNEESESGVNLFDTTYVQAHEMFLLYVRTSPRSLLQQYEFTYGKAFCNQLGLLWPAFLHELQQAL